MNAYPFAAIGITAYGIAPIVVGPTSPSVSRSRHFSAAVKSYNYPQRASVYARMDSGYSNESALQIGVEIQRRQRIFGRSGRI
jgi:hypothetical protein